MSVKTYGIYIAYPPTIDLRHEGLGRYLASFIHGTLGRPDVDFVVVCPSWSRPMLEELFESEGVPGDKVRVLAPAGKPYLLRAYEAWHACRNRTLSLGLRKRLANAVRFAAKRLLGRLEQRVARTHDLVTFLPLLFEGLVLLLLLLVLSPLLLPLLLMQYLRPLVIKAVGRIEGRLRPLRTKMARLHESPKDDGWVLRMFAIMNDAEAQRMQKLIDDLPDVAAWYAPAAFWPAFNRISAPRLMCVPDVVLGDFSVSFSGVGGNRFLDTFENIRATVRGADHMVTYSEEVKWRTLVDRYGVPADRISVVHHAPNALDRWSTIDGSQDAENASQHYCESLLLRALLKSTYQRYTVGVQNGALRFLFYASQFRPNKNVMTLLKAYDYLLRRRYLPHKLILTGSPKDMPEIEDFIVNRHLENDVLCVRALTVPELAACYKLADLAVNPSLSEGGCPFTFTEALSVGTPALMARISVSEEVLRDPILQEATFFDPYRWENLAERIEWALLHRDEILSIQQQAYAELKQRTWTDVANEHIALLEQIAASPYMPVEGAVHDRSSCQ
jgi:glycosyltransferase involved in cell wall biosynthesis